MFQNPVINLTGMSGVQYSAIDENSMKNFKILSWSRANWRSFVLFVSIFVSVALSTTSLIIALNRSTESHPRISSAQMNLSSFANRSVLFIAAHPDDVVGANGGFVASLSEVGANISVLIITNGNAGCNTSLSKAECAAVRRLEEIDCDGVLGVPSTQIKILDFDDNHSWDGTYLPRDIVAYIVRSVRDVQPFAVFTFFPQPEWSLDPKRGYDDMGFHPDHQCVGNLVASAIAGFSASDPAIYNNSYGTAFQPEQLWFWKFSKPPFCFAISENLLMVKTAAFLKHRSQYSGNGSTLVQWMREFSSLVGVDCGCEWAEGFHRYF